MVFKDLMSICVDNMYIYFIYEEFENIFLLKTILNINCFNLTFFHTKEAIKMPFKKEITHQAKKITLHGSFIYLLYKVKY